MAMHGFVAAMDVICHRSGYCTLGCLISPPLFRRLRENADTAISCRRPGPAGKKRYASSREEGGEDAQMCLCGKAKKSSHIVGEREVHKEERHVLKEMRQID